MLLAAALILIATEHDAGKEHIGKVHNAAIWAETVKCSDGPCCLDFITFKGKTFEVEKGWRILKTGETFTVPEMHAIGLCKP